MAARCRGDPCGRPVAAGRGAQTGRPRRPYSRQCWRTPLARAASNVATLVDASIPSDQQKRSTRSTRNRDTALEESTMWHGRAVTIALGVAIAAAFALSAENSYAQTGYGPNDAPNPYKFDYGWAKLPDGRKWGAAVGVAMDRDGKSVWVFDRCETATDCSKSKVDPIMKFDSTGKMVKSFGGGMINYPHGLQIDPDNNFWVTDGRAMNNGKGHTVMKFSQDGKLLMTLGKPGVAGSTPDTFNSPSDILMAPNGDIFVADGHGGDSNNRIVKFTKDGKYIKEWGKKGTGPGEFDVPHGLAMDSAGRLFVADRSNNRIQIFDQSGKFLAEWKQFGRPSGIFIAKDDTIYVVDSESNTARNPGFKRGIRIGSAKDGSIRAFIPDVDPNPDTTPILGAEGVGVDNKGDV